MRDIVFKAIVHRKVTLFFVVALVIYGLVSYYFLPKQENPDLDPTIGLVTAVYPGALPEDMEKLVTRKIEDAVSEIRGFDSVRSYSKNSISIVIVYLKPDADREKSWLDLRQRIDDLYPKLPQGCWKPEINTKLGETAGLMIAFSGQNYTYDQLEAYAELFKERLRRIKGVVRFDIVGKVDRVVKVTADMARLNQHRLSLEDLWKLLQAQNLEIPAGAIEREGMTVNVSVPGKFSSLRDIENTVIDVSSTDGSLVRLRDVATVSMGLKDDASKIRHNGQDAVILAGYFEEKRNVLIIGDEVRAAIEDVKRTLPPDLVVDEVLYQPDDVRAAVRNFMSNLLEGMLFVIIVVFLGMGFRNAMVVATAIPLSILVTYIVMGITGLKVHQISTVALIIALGMLVDNAVVISDAIQVKLDAGIDRVKAAFEGTTEVALPVFTSTLTTVAGFFPLLLLPGNVGQYVISVPQLVIISLTASYFVAMFVTPTMALLWFRPGGSGPERTGGVRRVFQRLLAAGLDRPVTALLITLAITITMLSLGGLFLPIRFFPNADKNIIAIDITSEIAELTDTEKVVRQVENILQSQPEVTKITTVVGDDLPKFYVTMIPHAPSKEYGQAMFRVDLKKTGRFRDNETFGYHLQQELDAKVTGGTAKVKILQQAEPMDAPVMFRITGTDLRRLKEVSHAIQDEFRMMPELMNVRDNAAGERLEYTVRVDDDVATSLGILKYDVQRQINLALRGDKASVFRSGGNEYDIIVESNIASIEELGNLAVKSTVTGNKVLLKQFADITLTPKTDYIYRFDKEYSISALADMVPGFGATETTLRFMRDALPRIDTTGVRVVHDGEMKNIIDNFSNLGIAAIAAIFFNYLILILEFKSLLQPFIILTTVPLSVIGALAGLLLFRQPFSFTAFLGITSLIGVVVNNAILLMEYINNEKAKGHDLKQACIGAVARRYRPIMLSNITTVMGLLPLATSGSQLFTPMSVAQMSGLLIATLLTLVVIPVTYYRAETTIGSYRGKREGGTS
mgnify:CR=1 FL=1